MKEIRIKPRFEVEIKPEGKKAKTKLISIPGLDKKTYRLEKGQTIKIHVEVEVLNKGVSLKRHKLPSKAKNGDNGVVV